MADDVYVRLCLQEIVKLDLEAKAIIQDIRQDADSIKTLDSYNAHGRQKISQLRIKIADLERLGLEQERDTDRDAILTNVESLRQKLSSTISGLRQACVSTKLILDQKAKNDLLSGKPVLRKRGQESLAKKNSEITESLININRTMAEQVKQSENNITTLAGTTQTVTDNQKEFHSMGDHIQNSQRLLTKYGRREFTDRILILLALLFFFATVLYIIKKRMFM